VLLAVGDVCAVAGLPKPAENCFRRAVKLEPLAYGGLARWLASVDRLPEAVEVCAAATEADTSAQPAVLLATLLLSGKPTAEARQAAEPVLQESIKAHPDDASLLLAVGTLRLMEGRTAEAIKYLRDTLKVDPRQLDALNNLAMLLAEDPKTQGEAISFIDRALAIAGSSPELLDSKGWILLKSGKYAEAQALFEEALALPPGDPRHRFHLALAFQQQGKLDEAKQNLVAARDGQLTEGLLSPEERGQLAKLEEALR
jgi:tetratricopeptide (TPR) repeat protein